MSIYADTFTRPDFRLGKPYTKPDRKGVPRAFYTCDRCGLAFQIHSTRDRHHFRYCLDCRPYIPHNARRGGTA